MKGLLSSFNLQEKQQFYFISLTWGANLVFYLTVVFSKIPVIGIFQDWIIPLLYVIGIFLFHRSVSEKIFLKDIVLYLGLLLLYLIQYAVFPNNADLLSENFVSIFFETIPYFFIGLLLKEEKHLYPLSNISILFIVVNTAYYFAILNGLVGGAGNFVSEEGEKMGLAYQYFPHVLIVFWSLLEKFSVPKLAIFLVGFFVLLGTGNRGSILLFTVFVMLYFIVKAVNGHSKKVVFFIMIIAIVFLVFQKEILDWMYGMLDLVGFNSRVLRMLNESEFMWDNGRDELTIKSIEKIQESSFLGYGILGDRPFFVNMDARYPHNLFLELLLHFGLYLGGILVVLLIILTIRAFFKSITTHSINLFLFLLVIGLLPLFVSHTYLESPMFFLFLGFCVNLLRGTCSTNTSLDSSE